MPRSIRACLGTGRTTRNGVQINLQTPRTFNRIKLVSRPDGPYGFPRSFEIEVWDGTRWQTRVTANDHAQPAPNTAVTFNLEFPDTTDDIRVHAKSLGSDNHGGRVLQLAELELYNA
jgi:F5/8 type C domain